MITAGCLVEQRNAETYRERMRQIHRQTDRETERQGDIDTDLVLLHVRSLIETC